MLRAVQAVGWGFLDPQPLWLRGPVVALIGQNGSGKSSMLDAIKALLGARRFGQGRTASSYRFAGRAGEPPLEKAWVAALIENDGRLRSRPRELTLLMEVGERQRRFAVLDGCRLADPEGDAIAQMRELSESLSRSAWMRPAQWEEKVLLPLGIGPAMRRLLELPQGEIQRALDRDPARLLELLIELSGGRAAAERFRRASEALAEARRSQAEARRRLDRSRRELAEQKLAAREAAEARRLRERLAELGARAAALLAANPEPKKQKQAAPALLDIARLRRAGLEPLLESGYWRVRPEDAARARDLLGPGESLPLAGVPLEQLERVLAMGRPLGESEEPASALSPRARRALKRIVAELERAGVEVEPARDVPDDPAELIGAFGALASDGVPADPGETQERELAERERRVAADEAELERRRALIDEAQEQLEEARELYERAVARVLERTAERFAELCERAGMRGVMEIRTQGGAAAECRIQAAEAPGEELRPLHGARASMSGGWRASVVTLAILACLGAEEAPPVLLLDEVAASLDEERLAQLGGAFARLGADGELLTVITVPSKTVSQTVAAFASQQIAFLRPAPGEALAPPPHVVVASRRLRAAA